MLELLRFNGSVETRLVVDHVLVLVRNPEWRTGIVEGAYVCVSLPTIINLVSKVQSTVSIHFSCSIVDQLLD